LAKKGVYDRASRSADLGMDFLRKSKRFAEGGKTYAKRGGF